MGGSNQLPSPEDLSIPSEIITAAKLGRLAFFVGNGISRLYGLPSWEDLCARMLNALATSNIIDHNKVALLEKQSLKAKISIADHYFKNHKDAITKGLTYTNMLHNGLSDTYRSKATAYSSLAKCSVKFITTNYDNLLYEALEGADRVTEVVQNIQVESEEIESTKIDKTTLETIQFFGDPLKFDRVKLLNNKVVFHLHGSINDEKTIISSTTDYLKLYANQNIRSFLSWFFENHVVIFLGYGLEEMELLDLIVRSGSGASNGCRKSSFYLLLPLLSYETEILDQLQIYYKQLGINILPFSRDKKGYAAYADLLERWSGELTNVARDPTRVDSLFLLDQVITEFESRPS